MHEAERLRVRPRLLDVIDLKRHIGRHPRWLDRAEVVADDDGLRELLAYLHCPDVRRQYHLVHNVQSVTLR